MRCARIAALMAGTAIYSIGLVAFREALAGGFADFPWIPFAGILIGASLIGAAFLWERR